MSDGELLTGIKNIIKQAEKTLEATPKSVIGVKTPKAQQLVLDTILKKIYNLIYGNMISNFKKNFNDENMEEYSISKEEERKVITNFKGLFEKAEKSVKGKASIIPSEYEQFKDKIKSFGKGSYRFLEELEKLMGLKNCEYEIEKLKMKAKSLGREIDIPIILKDKEGREISRKNISKFTRH